LSKPPGAGDFSDGLLDGVDQEGIVKLGTAGSSFVGDKHLK